MASDEAKVWIRKRVLKNGETAYHLRWIDLLTGKWRNRKTSAKTLDDAKVEAKVLQKEIDRGAHQDVRTVSWRQFSALVVGSIAGKEHRRITERVLGDFGKLYNVSPKRVKRVMLKAYVTKLRERGNSAATVNKAMRYMRLAFNEGVEDGYVAKHPMTKWKWEPEEEPMPREITDAEETAILDKAEELYGARFRAFILTALNSGGRCEELLGLPWDQIDLEPIEAAEVRFIHTKSKKPRRVPINPEDVDVLRRIHVQAQQDAGPFVLWDYGQVSRMFERTADKAGVENVTLHDCRRTYVTRLIRAEVELTAVKRLAGHSSVTTTLKYYNAVHKNSDLRAAVAKLRKKAAG